MARSVAVVTGGTGGLGGEVVHALVRGGWRVHVPWVTEVEAERLRERIGGANAVALHRTDLTDPDSVAALFAAVQAEDGGLDLLCNLVGGFAMGAIEDTDVDTWNRMWAANATAPFLAMRAAVPLLEAAPVGRIVNVAAAAALGAPIGGMSAYLAAKSALVSLTKNLAREFGPRGVTVNAVAPTTIDTPANRKAMPDADRGTWISAEEIAEVILFLAGPAAGVVTGNVLELRKG